MRKTIIKAALAFLVIVLSLAANGQNVLDVKEKSGTLTSYNLSDIRKLTFPTGDMVIFFSDNTSETFSLSTIQLLNFPDLTTGVDAESKVKGDSFRVYPVPVNNELNIVYNAQTVCQLQIQILDMSGCVVLNTKQNIYKGTNAITLNVSGLELGFYVCRINNGITVITKKIIKQ